MSKRRINIQQTNRIKKNQLRYQEEKNLNPDLLSDGLVISRFGRLAKVETPDGKRLTCSIRPNLDIIVAGDRVIWQPEGTQQGVIVSIYPRASMLARPSAHGLQKPVAANITQMVIVCAPKPEISWPLLDSYLIMADLLRLHAIILLNKTDLECDSIKKTLIEIYAPLGYPLVMSGLHETQDFAVLQGLLDHQVSVFVGQSGVGKSSLIARLLPHETEIISGQISERSELGKHTTSNSKYYHIPSGGALIDSPGVREFSLWQVEPASLAASFVEFRPLISQCKYRNCSHKDTPHCAIIEAVNNGTVSPLRYENYLKLMDNY